MFLRAWQAWVGFVLLGAAGCAVASSPLLTRFRPDVDVWPQYFCTARSADGMLYLGGRDVVLRYDGVRWETFRTPRPGTVRALLLDRQDRLWVGGTEWFGRLERTDDGGERIVDYAPAFAADVGADGFDDIWDIVVRDDGVYFRALRWLFHADAQGRRLHAWHAPNRFGGIVESNGELLVNWRGEGIKRRVGDAFELVPGSEAFAAKPAFSLVPLDARRLLVHDQTPRLSLLEDGRVKVLATGGDTAHMHRGIPLDAGHAVFSGDDGVLRIVDAADGSIQPIAIGYSFQSSIVHDRDGALLLSDDEGALRLPWPPSWRAYGKEDGISGTVHDAVLLDGMLRVQSGAGEAIAPWGPHGATGPFKPLDTTPSEAWSVLVDGSTRILAESYGLRRLDAGNASIGPDDLYPRVFERSPTEPARAWIGTESGFARLERIDGNWTITARHTDLHARVISLVETAPDEVWLGAEGGGVMRARVDAGGKLVALDHYDAELGHDPKGDAYVSRFEGKLIVSTPGALFRREGERFVRESLGGLDELAPADESLRLRVGDDGTAWAWSFRAVYRRAPDGTWRRVDELGSSNGAIENLRPLPGGDVLVAASRFLHYDASTAAAPGATPTLRLAAVRWLPRNGTPSALSLREPAVVPHGGGSLVFQLSLVDLARGAPPQFRVRMAGLDEHWSDWSSRAEFDYAQIPAGDYRFEAQARSAGGAVYGSQPFAFRVEPRWYQRSGLHFAAALALAALVAFALSVRHRTRIRRLDARNRELDALVRAHTSELEHANSQLRDLAERDGLTGVANRRRFDAFLDAALTTAPQRPLAVLLVDVDHFKAYNDANGHLAGDEALRRVAAALCGAVRDNTLVARFGGEEFALVVPNCTLADATELGRRLCDAVATHCRGVTVSVGVTSSTPERRDAQALVASADAALYRAKRNGRNRSEA